MLYANLDAADTDAVRPRNLRDVIPAGKGRIDPAEYLGRIRRGQCCGMQSLLKLVNAEHSGNWQKPSAVCIVGGGPSLVDEVGMLRRLVKHGAKVLAVNKSHDWLLKRGLPCDYVALLDPKDWVAEYIDLKLSADKRTRRKAGKFGLSLNISLPASATTACWRNFAIDLMPFCGMRRRD